MIPVYICDDEAPIRQRLEQIVAGQIMILDSDMGPVRAVEEPDELLRLQKEDSVPAIYFLDIDFPGKISGLELAQKLRQYDPALDYIVKGETASMITRVQSCLESIRERMLSQRPGQGSYCTVKILDTVRHIPTDSILYLEAVGYRHTLRLHLDEELLEFNSSLDHFAAQLGGGFWRCHRGFLVNRNRIRSVHLKEQLVELDNGETCLLSRKAKSEYQAQI